MSKDTHTTDIESIIKKIETQYYNIAEIYVSHLPSDSNVSKCLRARLEVNRGKWKLANVTEI
jgi:hypothetical protein